MPLARHKIKRYDYNERDMEGTVASDSGAQIRDGIKSVAKLADGFRVIRLIERQIEGRSE